MFTISLRGRSRNEIFISNFKRFVLLLPTQAFFYFMAIKTQFVCETDLESFLYVFLKSKKLISICIKHYDEINSVHLSKEDVKVLIEELNLLIKNLD